MAGTRSGRRGGAGRIDGVARGQAAAPQRSSPLAGPAEAAGPPPGTTELGIDIIRVARISDALARFGERFCQRILTSAESRYVRGRAATLAGRWAAKEAVSKVLGLGVRGIGWRDIEIERLPTGQPAVALHGRAARRAEQLGMSRVAISISHEAEFAVAIAYGVRSAGGRFLYPPDVEQRIDDREAYLMRRLERLKAMGREAAILEGQLTQTAGRQRGQAGDA
jgi:holo-[acyl-carrier protein] synthase